MVGFRHELEIAATPSAVHAALTDAGELSAWWTRAIEGAPGAVGATTTFRFVSGAFNTMRWDAVEPQRLVAWTCVDGADEWIGTRVRFELEPLRGGEATRLRFEHGGWRAATPYFELCDRLWGETLASLVAHCETGRGTPDPGPPDQ